MTWHDYLGLGVFPRLHGLDAAWHLQNGKGRTEMSRSYERTVVMAAIIATLFVASICAFGSGQKDGWHRGERYTCARLSEQIEGFTRLPTDCLPVFAAPDVKQIMEDNKP